MAALTGQCATALDQSEHVPNSHGSYDDIFKPRAVDLRCMSFLPAAHHFAIHGGHLQNVSGDLNYIFHPRSEEEEGTGAFDAFVLTVQD